MKCDTQTMRYCSVDCVTLLKWLALHKELSFPFKIWHAQLTWLEYLAFILRLASNVFMQVRKRPLNKKELAKNEEDIIDTHSNSVTVHETKLKVSQDLPSKDLMHHTSTQHTRPIKSTQSVVSQSSPLITNVLYRACVLVMQCHMMLQSWL